MALKKEPELYTQIPRGYKRESVLRWGVRHSLDMRAAYSAWTGGNMFSFLQRFSHTVYCMHIPALIIHYFMKYSETC